MTTEEIKSYLLESRGPIQIRMSDGRKLIVAHTDFLMFHPIGNGIFLFNPNGSYVVINKEQISSLEK